MILKTHDLVSTASHHSPSRSSNIKYESKSCNHEKHLFDPNVLAPAWSVNRWAVIGLQSGSCGDPHLGQLSSKTSLQLAYFSSNTSSSNMSGIGLNTSLVICCSKPPGVLSESPSVCCMQRVMFSRTQAPCPLWRRTKLSHLGS